MSKLFALKTSTNKFVFMTADKTLLLAKLEDTNPLIVTLDEFKEIAFQNKQKKTFTYDKVKYDSTKRKFFWNNVTNLFKVQTVEGEDGAFGFVLEEGHTVFPEGTIGAEGQEGTQGGLTGVDNTNDILKETKAGVVFENQGTDGASSDDPTGEDTRTLEEMVFDWAFKGVDFKREDVHSEGDFLYLEIPKYSENPYLIAKRMETKQIIQFRAYDASPRCADVKNMIRTHFTGTKWRGVLL